MRVFSIPKHSGGVRTIYAPDAAEKETLRALLPALSPMQDRLTAAHGFKPRHNVVTAALPHVGMAVTVSLDLKDFFDHCTRELAMQRGVPAAVADEPLAFPDGAARQGLPTSPAVANICAKALDEAIIRILRKAGFPRVNVKGKAADFPAAYTRYADDLSISFLADPGETALRAIIGKIVDAARMVGLPVNPRKVRVQRATGGRREICGVMVDAVGVYPRRDFRRKLRAAEWKLEHATRTPCGIPGCGCPGFWQALTGTDRRAHERHLGGLREFASLKVPRTAEEHAAFVAAQSDKSWQDAQRIASHMGWTLDRAWVTGKVGKNQDLGDHCKVTVDAVDFLNMGQVHYVNSESISCLRRGGEYQHGPLWWLALPGAALGLMTDDKGSIEYAGVRRPRNAARVILYYMRDGGRFYGRFYGDRTSTVEKLRAKLESAGFRPIRELARDAEAVGHVRGGLRRPYFDFGYTSPTVLRPSGETACKLCFGANC